MRFGASEILEPRAPSDGGVVASAPRRSFAVDVDDAGRFVGSVGEGSAGDGGLAVVFDVSTLEPIGQLATETALSGVDVRPDGRFVVAFGERELHVFDVERRTWKTLDDVVSQVGQVIRTAALRPVGTQVLLAYGIGLLRAWDWSRDVLDGVLLPRARAWMFFLADDTLTSPFPMGSSSMLTLDLDTREGRTVQLERPPGVMVGPMRISPDGELLVGTALDGRMIVWDLTTGRLRGDPAIRPRTSPSFDVDRTGDRGIAFSPTAPHTVAVGSETGGIWRYDIDRERPVGVPLHGHGGAIVDVASSADGLLLVGLADDGLIDLWTAGDGYGPIGRLAAPGVSDADFVDGGSVLVQDAERRTWVRSALDLDAPGVIVRSPRDLELEGAFLSDDGTAVVGITRKPSSKVFVADAATGEMIWENRQLDFVAVWAGLSPDARLVAAVDGRTGSLRVWDVATGERLGDVQPDDARDGAPAFTGHPRFRADGGFIDIAVGTGIARIRTSDLQVVSLASSAFAVQGFDRSRARHERRDRCRRRRAGRPLGHVHR